MGDRTVGTPLIEWLRRVDPRSIEDLPSALSTREWLGQVRRLQAGFQPLAIAPRMTNAPLITRWWREADRRVIPLPIRFPH